MKTHVTYLEWAITNVGLPHVKEEGITLTPISGRVLMGDWRKFMRLFGVLEEFLGQPPWRGDIYLIKIRFDKEDREVHVLAAQSRIPGGLREALQIPPPPPLPL